MAGYTFTPILTSYQTSGYYQLTGFNNSDQLLFSFGAVYGNGALTNIVAPSGQSTYSGVAINNSGEVLASFGSSNDPYFIGNVGGSPTLFAPAPPPNSPSPPNGYSNFVDAYDLNDSGAVVGDFNDQGGIVPFLYANGNTTLLFNPAAPLSTRPTALNNSDQIVGNYGGHGVLYDPANGGTWTTIDDPAAG